MAKRRRRRQNPKHTKFLREHRHLYESLLAEQGGKCICGRKPSDNRRLDMDHNHQTMQLRGLLCVRCNRAFRDWMTVEWLEAAIQYLHKAEDRAQRM